MAKVKKLTIFGFVAILGLVLLTFITIKSYNAITVTNLCVLARTQYTGDCTTALMSLVEDDTKPLSNRNTAVWALGQKGDKKAMVVLQKYYAQDDSLNANLNKQELKKAIDLMNSPLNVTAFLLGLSQK